MMAIKRLLSNGYKMPIIFLDQNSKCLVWSRSLNEIKKRLSVYCFGILRILGLSLFIY